MKVLFIEHVTKISGQEKVLLQVLKHLPRDIEAHVIVPGPGPFVNALVGLLDRVSFVPMSALETTTAPMKLTSYILNGLSTINALYRYIKAHEIDLVYTNSSSAHLYGAVAGWLANVPVIWHVHDIFKEGRTRKIFISAARRFATQILVVSHAVANVFLEGGLPFERVRVVHNGIDLSEWCPQRYDAGALRREIGATDDEVLIGIVAQLTPWKGQNVFLEAADKVASQAPNARFIVVGDSLFDKDGGARFKNDLRNIVLGNGLESRTHFMGQRDDVPQILAGLDIFVHASVLPDPLPLVVLEAMAMKKGMVASAVGGVPEMVTSGRTGYLVPPGDPDATARAILDHIQNTEQSQQMRELGRRVGEEHFSQQFHLSNLFAEIRDVSSRMSNH